MQNYVFFCKWPNKNFISPCTRQFFTPLYVVYCRDAGLPRLEKKNNEKNIFSVLPDFTIHLWPFTLPGTVEGEFECGSGLSGGSHRQRPEAFDELHGGHSGGVDSRAYAGGIDGDARRVPLAERGAPRPLGSADGRGVAHLPSPSFPAYRGSLDTICFFA